MDKQAKKILVIGETCIDEFVYGQVDRISQESPCPIFLANDIKESTGGMCTNVKNNIEHLSGDLVVDIVTNTSPIIKRRLIDTRHNVMVYRIDESDATSRIDISLISNEAKYDAVIVSDYNKGFLLDEDLSSIGSLFQCPKFIDTKKIISKKWSFKFDFIKINSGELFENISSHGSLGALSSICHNIISTKSEQGAILYSTENYSDKQTTIFDGYKTEVAHVSGAGDTFLASLVVRFLETDNIKESIDFANQCASIAVSKENVSLVSRKEIDNARKSNRDL
jgi:bifunctional ADP-heptose synthase (sugar kinase/adenylyltransferase)|tara:strand:- start:1802 stop:2644 length:843 start_codon:yes stop_codon:yes gene_type:complete